FRMERKVQFGRYIRSKTGKAGNIMDAVVTSLQPRADVAKGERSDRPTRAQAEVAARTLIEWIGDNPNREALLETPERLVRALEDFSTGYTQRPEDVLDRTFGEIGHFDDLVLVCDIPFFSY